MVQKPDIQYVTQFYSYGSEAKVLELKPAQKKQKAILPKAKPAQKLNLKVDPVAWAGILVALVMAVMMVVSVNNYLNACEEYKAMTNHVITLHNTNVQQQLRYEQMYDPDDIREKALALGMVPMEDALVITITPVIPEEEPEATWWENVSWFMKGLFA